MPDVESTIISLSIQLASSKLLEMTSSKLVEIKLPSTSSKCHKLFHSRDMFKAMDVCRLGLLLLLA